MTAVGNRRLNNTASGADYFRIDIRERSTKMVFEKIREALADQFEKDPETITRDTDIMSDL